jgi:hypothetical protein
MPDAANPAPPGHKETPSPQASALQGVNEANLRRPRNTAKGTGATRAEPSRLEQCKNQGRQLWLAWRGRGFEALGREAAGSARTDGHAASLLCPARALSEKARAGGSGREVLSTADYDEQRRPREAAKGAEKYEGNKAKACLRRLPFGYCCRLSLSPSTPLAFAL